MQKRLPRTINHYLIKRGKHSVPNNSVRVPVILKSRSGARFAAADSLALEGNTDRSRIGRNRFPQPSHCHSFNSSRSTPIKLKLKGTLLHSSIHHTAFAFIAIAVATAVYFGLSTSDSDLDASKTEDVSFAFGMSSQQPPNGHVGNLSPEQEDKLRKFWQAIANVCGWSEDGSTSMRDAAKESAAATATADADADAGKWRFGLFRKTENSGAGNADAFGSGSEDDKFGLAKQFNEVLAKQSAESIRETIWSMVKHDHPDALALRFLRARKWDVQKAVIMFITAMNWRQSEMHVDDDIMKNGEGGAAASEKDADTERQRVGHDFMQQLRIGKSFLHGTDKEGRPICVVRVRLHRNGDQCAESIERYTVHIIETARLLLVAPVETATIVFDMTNFTLANMDYAPVKFMIKCFEANYPESLGAVLIHNAPWVFQGIWRIIRGWLDPVVAAKVHFTNGRGGLEEYIEPSKIIKELGGDEAWEYKYVEPIEGENKAMEDSGSKGKILEERAKLVRDFEESTKIWIRDADGEEGKKAANRRSELASQLRANYWKLDPYIRARSVYDRQGVIKAGGSIDYYPAQE